MKGHLSRMLKLKPPIRKPVIVLLLALLPSFFLLTFKGKMTDVSAHAGSTTLVIDPGCGVKSSRAAQERAILTLR